MFSSCALRFRLILFLTGSLLPILTAPVMAAQVAITFKGTLTVVGDPHDILDESVQVGSHFSATYLLGTQTTGVPYTSTGMLYDSLRPQDGACLSFGDYHVVSDPREPFHHTYIYIDTATEGNYLEAGSLGSTGDGLEDVASSISLTGAPGLNLLKQGLPPRGRGLHDLTLWQYTSFFLSGARVGDENMGGFYLNGTIDAAFINAKGFVPEPGPFLWAGALLMGSVLLGIRSYRGKGKRAYTG